MDTQATSPVTADAAIARPTLVSQWRALRKFVADPVLPDQASGFSSAALAAVLRLYAIDLALMIVLLSMAGLAVAAGFELPANALEELEIGPAIIFAIVIIAPLAEEIVFRGWLSGRPAHLALVLLLAIGALAVPFVGGITQGSAIGMVLAAAGVAALAVLAWWNLRQAPPPGWFRVAFRWIFYASAALFACAHLLNYAEGGAVLLALVLPQFIAGLIFGFARVQYGLWASIALHVLHNATFISLALLGESAA